MKIFVTGATGFVGSGVVQALLRAGHEVVGLVRSDAAAKSLAAAGAKIHRGDLQDFESLRKGAAESDGVIHTGFIHDFSKFKENCELDRKVVETLGSALAGSDRPLIVTSAIGVLSAGQIVTEDTKPVPPGQNPRAATEEAVRALMDRDVCVSIVRLSRPLTAKTITALSPFSSKWRKRKMLRFILVRGKIPGRRCIGWMRLKYSSLLWKRKRAARIITPSPKKEWNSEKSPKSSVNVWECRSSANLPRKPPLILPGSHTLRP